MYKLVVCLALIGAVLAAPEPKPVAKADPGLVAAAYTAVASAYSAPIVAAPALTYSASYAAPLAYSSGYVAAPSVYSAGYGAYSAPYVVV